MTDDIDYKRKVFAAMAEHGGSFVKALADAWMKADAPNKQKIEEAFSNYIAAYARFVKS